MPVLSEQPHNGMSTVAGINTIYIFVGAILVFCIGLFITRRRRAATHTHNSQIPNHSEKQPLVTPPTIGVPETASSALAKPRKPIPYRDPAPPPLPSPTTEMSSSFESFAPSPSAAQFEIEMPPRRRSYTKATPDGGEVSGEIVVAEGWRRHTRVFGGGVCKACEESERRMSA